MRQNNIEYETKSLARIVLPPVTGYLGSQWRHSQTIYKYSETLSEMDPERQPLLSPAAPAVTDGRYLATFRPLTHEQVLAAHRSAPWRRSRLCLVLMFWALVAMFLSVVVSMLVSSQCSPRSMPVVPPVHTSLAHLVSSIEA